jgi:hypothetical protein
MGFSKSSKLAISNSLFSNVDQLNGIIDERGNVFIVDVSLNLLSNLNGLLDVLEASANVIRFYD